MRPQAACHNEHKHSIASNQSNTHHKFSPAKPGFSFVGVHSVHTIHTGGHKILIEFDQIRMSLPSTPYAPNRTCPYLNKTPAEQSPPPPGTPMLLVGAPLLSSSSSSCPPTMGYTPASISDDDIQSIKGRSNLDEGKRQGHGDPRRRRRSWGK